MIRPARDDAEHVLVTTDRHGRLLEQPRWSEVIAWADAGAYVWPTGYTTAPEFVRNEHFLKKDEVPGAST